MNTAPISESSSVTTALYSHLKKPVWGAIIAGAVAALALQIVFMMLGAGLGLAMYNPITSDNPLGNFGEGAAVIQGITAVFSLWGGGWVAGRFLGRAGLETGCLHGFMVWGVATVVAIGVISTGAGWALGDLSKLVGGGLSLAGKPAAAAVTGATDLAKDSLDRNRAVLGSFLDEGLGKAATNNATAAEAIRLRRELGFAITHLFTSEPSMMEVNQQAVIKTLVDGKVMSEAEAEKTVAGWRADYQKLKADLDAAKVAASLRARDLAETTSKSLAILSLCYFVAFVFGAVFATLGGKHGGACAYSHAGMDPLVETTEPYKTVVLRPAPGA